MTSEEYLKNVVVGEATVYNKKIELEEYNRKWPVLFQTEATKIQTSLADKAIQIEHVGSTSVPGLCAKPVIDILLIVRDSSDEGSYMRALEDAGYELHIREPDWFEHRMFRRSVPAVNLHVFSHGCEEAERMLAFRNWLRESEQDRTLYATAKKQLADQVWKYIQNYADAKTQVVRDIMGRAWKN